MSGINHRALLEDAKEVDLNPPKRTFMDMIKEAEEESPVKTETAFERPKPKPPSYEATILFADDDMFSIEFAGWKTAIHYLQALTDGGNEPLTVVLHRKGK